MSTLPTSTRLSYLLTVLVCAVILTDFALPGTSYTSEINYVKKERQQYYNAAGNFHYTYKVVTDSHSFIVNETLGPVLYSGAPISYRCSPIFNQVNSYQALGSDSFSTHSMRWVSGLILPLFLVLITLLTWRLRWNISNFYFILQVILAANLIYLLY